jgi:D-psicose/D-tagatose/L-ribulose 3-epimerase
LAAHRLGVTCSLGLPPKASLPDDPAAAEAFLIEAVEVAGRLGSPVLTGVIYGTLGVLPGRPPTEAELSIVADSIRRVAVHAGRIGMRLGLEPVNRYETHLVNLARQGLDLIDAIGEPNVFLHLDTYHMNIEEKGFREPILQSAARLEYVHLSESDRGTPGTGNVHWDDVFSALADIGYDHDLVMESFVAVNPDIARATCMWRQVAPSSTELVREGLQFLRMKARDSGLTSSR